jgi:hypothetical protein
MSVSWEFCVLSGTDLCFGLITRPEESYRVWCVWVLSWSLDKEAAQAPRGVVGSSLNIILSSRIPQWFMKHIQTWYTFTSYVKTNHPTLYGNGGFITSAKMVLLLTRFKPAYRFEKNQCKGQALGCNRVWNLHVWTLVLRNSADTRVFTYRAFHNVLRDYKYL